MTPNDAYEFFVELVSQLFHAGVLITEQAERIEALEAEVARLRTGPAEKRRRPHERPASAAAWQTAASRLAEPRT
jgi:uncharacterized small protein (DUF1192 family)